MAEIIKTERVWKDVIVGGLIVIGGLVIFGLYVMPDVIDGLRMQFWKSTQADLQSANLKKYYNNGNPAYRTYAEYKYFVDGKSYINNRVFIINNVTRKDGLQYKTGSMLEQYLKKNRPVTIWYNPNNPQEAIINRALNWAEIRSIMIFVILAWLVGGLILFFSLKGEKINISSETRAAPWLRYPKWANGKIKSNSKTRYIALWVFTILWNVPVLAGVVLVSINIYETGKFNGSGVFIMLLAGLALLYWAVKSTREWKRFGTTLLTLEPYPGRVNGVVAGFININLAYRPELEFRQSLSCINRYAVSSGEGESYVETVKWQDTGAAQVEPQANTIKVSFHFKVPDNLPPSGEFSRNYYYWRLAIEASLEGADFNRWYDIPVFKS